jgi:DNA-3-methyladenine glycosylase II
MLQEHEANCVMGIIRLPVPKEFSFDLTIEFLKRSPRELLHRSLEDRVIKLLRIGNELVLFSARKGKDAIIIEVLHGGDSTSIKKEIAAYVTEWFDLASDLRPFYAMARKDELLKGLVRKYSGYRIIGQPDLYESLVWAVLGQQINLQFAYTLKQRFVEKFGESLEHGGQRYYLFPPPAVVARLEPSQLLELQFSRQKAAYTIGIAQAFAGGLISKQALAGKTLGEAKEELMKIKGIGNWTANYGLMKTFRYPDAFPLEDAGLHNALRNLMNLKAKPDLNKVRRIFKKYKGWEAYATLYFWRSL